MSFTAPPSQLHWPKKCNRWKELLIITKTVQCCQWISALTFMWKLRQENNAGIKNVIFNTYRLLPIIIK
jgi:hypothetical protein